MVIAVASCTFSAHAQEEAQQKRPRPPFDSAYPDVHDPVMAQGEDGRYYIFSTGVGINVMSSADMKTWREEQPVFNEAPQWATDSVPGYWGHTWAPDISFHNGLWHLYYSCSTFGKNGSAIGLAVSKTLDPQAPNFGWTDLGKVIVSHKKQDNWNAIDPNLYVADDGTPYLTFGSFWDGIQLMRLDSDLQTPVEAPVTIARRINLQAPIEEANLVTPPPAEDQDSIEAGVNAIEAPFLFRRGKYYYLMVSFDYCCQGQNSTYKTVYGRSTQPTGPFVDKEGRTMTAGGGTALVGPDERFFGVGHCSVYEFGGQWYFLCHAYDSEHRAKAKLFLKPLKFDEAGWLSL